MMISVEELVTCNAKINILKMNLKVNILKQTIMHS